MKAHTAPLIAAVLALATLAVPVTAQTSNNPIPGIDVVVKKKPAGSALVAATSGRDGRFSARVRFDPGADYEISLPCGTRTACPRLASLTVNGRSVQPVNDPPTRRSDDRNGYGIYIIGAVVLGLREPTTVVLAGQVTEGPGAGPREADPRIGDPRGTGPRADIGVPEGPVTEAGPTPQGLSPYAGIDIMFGSSKLTRVVGTSGRDGRFSGRVEIAPDEYEVTAACPPRVACPPFRLTSVRVDGRTISPDPRGRFVFTVRPGTPSVLVEANTAMGEISTTR
jgi:hypothetical protein